MNYFREGNSWALREFSREPALHAGYIIDLVRTGVGPKERNELYISRDFAVRERAFPDLTPKCALTTYDRAEYQAPFVLDGLHHVVGGKSLQAINCERLTPLSR